MSYNNAGSNGHNSGITGQGFNPGTFGQGSMNSVTKHLIMPGETAKEMMMKANFTVSYTHLTLPTTERV